jgi:hypothetical protein
MTNASPMGLNAVSTIQNSGRSTKAAPMRRATKVMVLATRFRDTIRDH